MKTMLITGANGQIGSYLAHAYHAEGYRLALFYHKRKERISSLENTPDCYLEAVDLTDYVSVQKALDNAAVHFQKAPDILVHCAALRSYDAASLAQSDPLIFEEVFRTNLFAAYNILRAILPLMQDKQHGRIVLFGSEISNKGLKNGSAYAAAKAAIISLMQSITKETAGTDILLNAISPAPVDTVLEEDFTGEYLEFRRSYFDNYLNSNPGAKLISKAEIKQVVDLLIQPDMHSLCGQEIFLTGGSF
jgi:NAD(P)-dependent dehydrogenase (short-subunit alcohol dehydrogenase family)